MIFTLDERISLLVTLKMIKNVYFDNDIEFGKLNKSDKQKILKDFVKSIYMKTGEFNNYRKESQ